MPYLITEKKRCLLSKNQRPVTMIFFRFMQLFQEKTGNSCSLSKSFCIFASKKNDWLWTRRSLKTSKRPLTRVCPSRLRRCSMGLRLVVMPVRNLIGNHLPIDKTWVGFGRRDQSHHVYQEGMGGQPYNSVLSQRNRRCHCPMSLNDEETACSLCSFYFDHFLFRRASCRLIRTSPLLSK